MPNFTTVSNAAPLTGTNEPKSRTPAQRDASRKNGASRGPVTDAGRRRSSRNGHRHGLRSRVLVLDAKDARGLAALRADLLRRWPVATPIERHWLERLAACHFRQQKLEAIEFLAMDAFLFDTDEPDAPEGKPRLPSLATLLRYRRQIAREMEEAGGNLHRLIDARLHRMGGTDGCEEKTDEDDAAGQDDDAANANLCTDALTRPLFNNQQKDCLAEQGRPRAADAMRVAPTRPNPARPPFPPLPQAQPNP
ncbi:MAG: hypothetical protein KDG89_05965 [Geminicoccaceae bacterium]|nr:hypothetical protein [Geminicoccaceae bacterium]